MADDRGVRVERDGHVTTIIMSRPERRNAVDGPMAKALLAAFRGFEDDESQSVAVLWGEDGAFCSGADLTALNDPARVHELDPEGRGDGPMGPSRMALSKPLLAAVAGYAVAGGLELALLADMRIVEASATFGVFCRRWGVPLIDGGTVRLPRIVGMGRAMDMILTGRPVGAEEALAMGLASRVVPDGQSRAVAEKIAHELAAFPQACMRADRAVGLCAMGSAAGRGAATGRTPRRADRSPGGQGRRDAVRKRRGPSRAAAKLNPCGLASNAFTLPLT